MSNVAASYSSKSTAVRGALRAGIAEDAFIVEQNAEGRWVVLVIPSKQDEFEASEAELAEQQGRPSHEEDADVANVGSAEVDIDEADLVEEVEVVAATKGKTPSYKQMPRLVKSEVEKPLAVIHAYLDKNPGLTRKQAVAGLVALGINFYTARTQYQKWYTKQKEAK